MVQLYCLMEHKTEQQPNPSEPFQDDDQMMRHMIMSMFVCVNAM